ncbi:MAG: hypothetical protein LQ342_004730 [Letrouitia transgressa]|nr:MAG: hypothetical protein LQ342_004730 [Letrouitia transgressa]
MRFANETRLISRQALAVACHDVDVRDVRAMIVGPAETPYQFGFFESLMSPNPYENEPGFENSDDVRMQADYVAKIRHETLRIAVIQRLEEFLNIHPDGTVESFPELEIETHNEYDEPDIEPPFQPFKDLCKRRFLWYYESYLLAVDKAAKDVRENDSFTIMPFEGGGNTMNGKFNYAQLHRRLQLIHSVLHLETDYWAKEGLVLVKKESSVAAGLQLLFDQVSESFRKNDMVTMDIDLDNKNPFVWIMTYFGRPMTNLDGGVFRIKMTISPRFPDEQPRVVFETPIFHHRISKTGIPCYFPKKADDLKSHVEAIVEAIEDTDPPYDPRTLVNIEASKLFWGSTDEKKQYNRQLRRSVQRSTE